MADLRRSLDFAAACDRRPDQTIATAVHIVGGEARHRWTHLPASERRQLAAHILRDAWNLLVLAGGDTDDVARAALVVAEIYREPDPRFPTVAQRASATTDQRPGRIHARPWADDDTAPIVLNATPLGLDAIVHGQPGRQRSGEASDRLWVDRIAFGPASA